jgi:hypothetical protein
MVAAFRGMEIQELLQHRFTELLLTLESGVQVLNFVME